MRGIVGKGGRSCQSLAEFLSYTRRWCMLLPRISKFGGIIIVLYYNDHDPPHFHIVGEYKTRIEIATGQYLKGDSPLPSSKEKDVIKWLEK
ncbi:DUF4160 domain-containing protein [Sporosarcina thermotolerans]|uniref:DUF4160 domain-containing protein n=1 Tax=Sporosarcina thermotolerans TaxID=633404 RepID=UPI003621B24D